jgi:hypothetical protein
MYREGVFRSKVLDTLVVSKASAFEVKALELTVSNVEINLVSSSVFIEAEWRKKCIEKLCYITKFSIHF